jgi:hypothetical protein
MVDALPPAPSPRKRRRLDGRRVLVSLLVVVALGLIALGFASGETGDPTLAITDPAIETVFPLPDSPVVPPQTQIVADLAAGYRGELKLDGQLLSTQDLQPAVVLPGEEPLATLPPNTADVTFDAALGTLTFTPREGTSVDEFLVDGQLPSGQHVVTVTYWPEDEGRESARTFSWRFNINA